MSPQIEIQLIAICTAASCAIPGVFLVLRRLSMLSDSITHTILLGIVLAFFITHDLSSPLLMLGAALMGVVTVWLTESLQKTRLVAEDASIGLVFPLLFSIAVILIARCASKVHLDTDAVLLGELAFAPFDRLRLFGLDFGPRALIMTGGLFLLYLVLVFLFQKELALTSFDPVLAGLLGISPAVFHYGFMLFVSLTAVGAFQAVGSILTVAFMVGSPATALLLSRRLPSVLLLSVATGGLSAVLGYRLAVFLDASIAGAMAACVGLLFLLAFFFSPRNGVFALLWRRKHQKKSACLR